MSKHTQGEWHAVKYPRSHAYVVTLTPGNARGDICNVLSGLGASDKDEVAANARLIAAAPALLEALQGALMFIRGEALPTKADALAAGEAAIATATQEASHE